MDLIPCLGEIISESNIKMNSDKSNNSLRLNKFFSPKSQINKSKNSSMIFNNNIINNNHQFEETINEKSEIMDLKRKKNSLNIKKILDESVKNKNIPINKNGNITSLRNNSSINHTLK